MADNALLKGLGGMMVGVGEGMVQQGKEKRALALEALRQNRLDQRAQADRDFRSSEASKARDAQSSMVKDTFTGEDGKSYILTAGGETRPLGVTMGENNKNDPSNVREAKWLVKNGVAPNLTKAYEMVRTQKTTDSTSMRQKALAWVAAQKDRYGRPKYTEPEAQAAAVSAYEKWATGDSDGAVMALKSLEPKDGKKDETAWYESLWSSIGIGSGGGDKPSAPEAKAPEQAQGGDLNLSPQEKRIVEYHRNSIKTGSVGTDKKGRPMTVFSTGIRVPDGPHKGKFASVPGWVNGKVLNEREAYQHWKAEIDAGKWPLYDSGAELNARSREIHQIMDNEEVAAINARGQGGSIPPAPRDKSKRKTGEIYKAPDGRKIKWMGNGWQLVE